MLTTTKSEKDNLWHQRLAHIGALTLKKIPDSVTEILISENKFMLKNLCKAYIKGKFSASPNHNTANTYYTKFGNYISSNLFGPVLGDSYKNIKYLFTLLDTATRWLNFHLIKIKIKKEALNFFKDIKIAVENQSSKKIKTLHTN